MKRDFFDTSHLRTSLGKRAVQGGATLMVSQIMMVCLQLLSTAILARILTPEDYGLLAMVIVVVQFMMLFRDAGLSTATIQRESINQAQVSNLLWINIAISITLMLIFMAVTPLISGFYEEPRLVYIAIALSTTFVIGGFSVQHQALLRRQMLYRQQAVISVSAVFVSSVVAIVMAWMGAGYWALVGQLISKTTAECAGAWIACSWRPSLPQRRSGVMPMLRFGGNLTAFSFINFFARNLDNILIGRFIGKDQLGIYSRAYNLLMMPLIQIRTPLTNLLLPALSSIQGDTERYRRTFFRSMAVVNLIAVFLMPVFIAAADWIILIFLGDQWMEAARIFSALAISAFTEVLFISPSWLFTSQGRGGDLLKSGVINSFICMIAFVIGLKWGIYGVALSYSVSGVILRTPIYLYWAGRSGPVSSMDLVKGMAPYVGLFLFNTGLIFAVRYLLQLENPFLGVLVAGSLNTAMVALVVFLNPGLRSIVMEVLSRFRRKTV